MPTEVASIARKHVGGSWRISWSRAARHRRPRPRFRRLQVFFTWLLEEGEIARSPMEPPQVPEQPVDIVDDDAFRRLLDVCSGRGFAALRDTAIIRLFIDSGMRVGEMAGINVDDFDCRCRHRETSGQS
jgi:integrase